MEFIYGLIDAVARFFAVVIVAIATLFGAAPQVVTQAPAPTQDIATTTRVTMQEPEPQLTAPQGNTSPQAGEELPSVTPAAKIPEPLEPADAPAKSFSQLNTETRAALINIVCTTLRGGYLNPISGSGVIVDSRGVILTAAHVAQYFLLRDYGMPGNIDCIVRAGSPAEPQYRAALLYLPPTWVAENAPQIAEQRALGTGERDYAFLLITGPYNPKNPLPSHFPALEPDIGERTLGEQILLAAYPAGFLSGETIATNLYASSALAYLTRLYSFEGTADDIDLFSIGGTILSQSGSSGGAAVPLKSGRLGGVISTAILEGSTGERDLRAITLSHIDESLKSAGHGGIKGLLSGDLAAKAALFNATVVPGLTAQLISALDGR